MPFKINARNKRVLIISDLHIPYSVKGYLRFLAKLKKEFKPQIVINIGDEVDYHDQSMHESDKDLDAAGIELDKSIDELQSGLHKLFPKMFLLESNHGSMTKRRAKKYGIPLRTLRSLSDLYGTPKWTWHNDILLQTTQGPVYLCHGKTGAYGKMVKESGASSIQGHFHGKFEITYHRGVLGTRFNMFVGCLVDVDSLAFAYGRNFTVEPILGCGGILANGEPRLFSFEGA